MFEGLPVCVIQNVEWNRIGMFIQPVTLEVEYFSMYKKTLIFIERNGNDQVQISLAECLGPKYHSQMWILGPKYKRLGLGGTFRFSWN